MSATAYFGFKCPKCGASVSFGQELLCPIPTCRTPMIPNPEARMAMNVYCKTCDASMSMVDSDSCPTCKGPLTRIPSP